MALFFSANGVYVNSQHDARLLNFSSYGAELPRFTVTFKDDLPLISRPLKPEEHKWEKTSKKQAEQEAVYDFCSVTE